MKSMMGEMMLLLLLITLHTSSALKVNTTVFQPGELGYPCIRIPAMIAVKNSLLAFAEVWKRCRHVPRQTE
jgi:hypothetical protein